MSWKLFLPTDEGGMTYFRRNNGDGTVSYMSSQDPTPILEQNKAMATHNDGYSASRDFRRVASIPSGLMKHWVEVEGWNPYDPNNAAKVASVLNSNEFAMLRTAPGQLGVSNGVMR